MAPFSGRRANASLTGGPATCGHLRRLNSQSLQFAVVDPKVSSQISIEVPAPCLQHFFERSALLRIISSCVENVFRRIWATLIVPWVLVCAPVALSHVRLDVSALWRQQPTVKWKPRTFLSITYCASLPVSCAKILLSSLLLSLPFCLARLPDRNKPQAEGHIQQPTARLAWTVALAALAE